MRLFVDLFHGMVQLYKYFLPRSSKYIRMIIIDLSSMDLCNVVYHKGCVDNINQSLIRITISLITEL